jgi:hypothetical protein
MEDFLAAGDALLARSPASAEEIGAAGAEARALVARLGEVAEVRGRLGGWDPRHTLYSVGKAKTALGVSRRAPVRWQIPQHPWRFGIVWGLQN